MSKKFKGIDFLIKAEIEGTETVIAGQRSCTLNRASDTLDVTCKDNEGWQDNLAGLKNWGVDTDGLIVKDDECFKFLETCFMEGTSVPVIVSTPLGRNYKGEAIITDFPIEAPYDDAATYSLSFTGAGKLEVEETASTASAQNVEQQEGDNSNE